MPRKKKSLEGTWQFRSEGPRVTYALRDAGKRGLRTELTFPAKHMDMGEDAWRSLFRFLLGAFTNVRPETMNARFARFVKEKRQAWRKKRRHRYRRYAATPVTRKSRKKVPPVPEVEEKQETFSDELLSVAKAAMKGKP